MGKANLFSYKVKCHVLCFKYCTCLVVFEDINIIKDASGASQQTASQDRLGCKGRLLIYLIKRKNTVLVLHIRVEASQQMAKIDLERMKKYKSMIITVGRDLQIDPALIAGIISRESRAGNVLQNGWGDYGRGWGLMQVDVSPTGGRHVPEGDWNSEEHLRQGTRILKYFIERIRNKFGDWTEAQQLKGV
ncbi:hypothetical protein WMY93_006303 [Mugilogobius chulae]|uniref:Lysozyme g n=1 Tax=Mugilogobius chulae TaxID=88201 RepID=A0AAW0PQV8_9GOBI